MSKHNFTKALIEALPPAEKGKRAYIYDSKVRGLGVAVTDRGTKTYIVYRWVRGKPERVTLGRFPDLSIEQARKLAEKANASFAMGENPADTNRKVRDEMKLGELFDKFLDLHAKVHKRSWEEDEAMFNRYLESWKGTKISHIQTSDVQALHVRLGEQSGPIAANRTRSLLHAMFNKAIEWGWHGKNPVVGVKKFKEKSRERFVNPHELPAFFEALNKELNDTLRDFFFTCILTGARRANVMAMRWEDVDLKRKTWNIRDTKAGEPHTLPLPNAAVKVLDGRKRVGEWVFPGKGKTGHLVEPKTGWKRILERSGLTDLRIHDLRRSLGSHMAAGGASLPIIGKALQHKSVNTTAIYARLNIDPVREAMEKATRTIVRLGKKSARKRTAGSEPKGTGDGH